MMRISAKIWNVISNKYVLATVVFLVWLIFFDSNNLVNQWRLGKELRRLKAEKQYYLKAIVKDREALKVLQTNKKNLERFAREKYLMKRDDEDVYILVPARKK